MGQLFGPGGSMKTIFVVLACALSSVALAAPPPAPQLSVSATDIRQLEFHWDPVRGAQSYELWFRSAPGAQWVKFRDQPAQRAPLFRIGVSVHLLDWQQARYYIRACNIGGCTASNVVGVNRERLAAIGFIKHPSTVANRFFGGHVAASADGKTFAVHAVETVGDEVGAAIVYVYRKTTASSGWRLEARIAPSTLQDGIGQPFIGDPLAISGDGNVLALGAWAEYSDSTPDNDIYQKGSVYLFRRDGTTWTQAQRILFAEQAGDRFGYLVRLDDAGRMLVVSHDYAGGSHLPGSLEVYRDAPADGNAQFMHDSSAPAPVNSGGVAPFDCDAIALSGDGRTLMRGCRISGRGEGFVQVLDAPGWSESARWLSDGVHGLDLTSDGAIALVQGVSHADVWKRTSGGWASDGRVHNGEAVSRFQRRTSAISRDGKIIAFGNPAENSRGIGPRYPPYLAGDPFFPSGGVLIWHRKASGWVLRRLVKPGSTNVGQAGSVALGDDGRLLIVGAPEDPSAATGIDGDRDDDSAPQRGAVWVY